MAVEESGVAILDDVEDVRLEESGGGIAMKVTETARPPTIVSVDR